MSLATAGAPASSPSRTATTWQPEPQKPKLLDRPGETLRARHYTRWTEQAYRYSVKRFIYFHHVHHPAAMAEPEINAFLTHLCAALRGVAPPRAARCG